MLNVGAQVARRYWWAMVLRGVLAIILGLVALFAPTIALLALIFVFGFYAIADGITAIAVALQERKIYPRWGWVLVEGILGVLAGIFAFVYPGETAVILLYIIAAWALLTGIMEVIAAFTTRGRMEILLLVSGILSIIFGVVLFIHPGAGILSILWLLGVYGTVFGISMIILGFRLRSTPDTILS